MSAISRATQTENSDRLVAVELRLQKLKSIFPEQYAALAESDIIRLSPTSIVEGDNAQPKSEKSTVSIGRNLTRVDRCVFQNINWDCYSLATRALLDAVFDKETLATKNISGVKFDSNGRKRSLDYILDPYKISDIVQTVKQKCKVNESAIRKVITIKCADTANTKRFRHTYIK